MENYALYLLKNALRSEIIAQESANQATAGRGFHMHKATMDAFIESKRIADERIPQLEEAIYILNKDLP